VSVKNLFGKKSISVKSISSSEDIKLDIESVDYLTEFSKDKERFVPQIDFEDPSKFSRFGSAEKYYIDNIKSIYKTYPYDGSFKEKLQWKNKSSDLVNYIFDNVYPKNNGFINVGEDYGTLLTSASDYYSSSKEEYISFNGTLNAVNDGNSLKKLFEKSNKLDVQKNRAYNLNMDGEQGATVEFFFKREDLSGSSKQVIFDIWNSENIGSQEYGRFKLEVHPGIVGEDDKFYIEVSSGSSGIVDAEIGSSLNFLSSWHHYAVAFINSGSSLKLQLFVDGDLVDEVVTGSAVSQVYGAINGQIGSLITAASGTLSAKGWGKLSGSLDEFRYWKVKRTDKEISRNFFTGIGGGTNTDDSNVNLGIYFKFNEGIYSTSSINNYDKNVLDYSGRISNGFWTGYSLTSRSTGSAIVEGGFAQEEEKDPVIYPEHEDILSILEYYSKIGREHDDGNPSYIFNTLPEWIAEEDGVSGGGIKTLMQVMSEFFDDLQIKIEHLPTLKNIEYSSGKPLPFSNKLLQNYNFETTELFQNFSTLEKFYSRNETENFEEKVYNIKNLIYQNIYNNLLYIYKSKGTEKSFRNLLRCFGIDENLIEMNVYADNVDFTIDDRFENRTIKKKYVNFNNIDRYDSSVHQYEQSGNLNSIGYLSGSDELKYYGSTLEAETIFPKKFEKDNLLYQPAPFVSCSLFGLHESTDGTWASPDRASIQVYAIKEEEQSSNVKFLLSSSYFGLEVTSSLFSDVYEEQKWNFALRVKHEKYPRYDWVSGSDVGDFIVELYGVNSIQDTKQQSFLITASVTSSLAEGFFEANKMIYAGAHRTNFSGAIVTGPGVNNEQFSDVKVSSVRFWNSYVEDDIIDLHSKDATNYGAKSPGSNVEPFLLSTLDSIDGFRQIPQAETLALHWDFTTVTSSDNGTGISTLDDGEFLVEDISSGSLDLLEINPISKYTKYQHTGKGVQFPRNSTKVVSEEYIYSGKRKNIENISSNDMIRVLDSDDEYYYRDSIPVNHFFSFEKSMYNIISQDMLNLFGTVKDFSNLIGMPSLRYEHSYKQLEKVRQMYFRDIENEPDFERFIDVYKWLDSSLSKMLEQLIPGSMNYSLNVSNMIESHILERNKYRHKLPTLEFKGTPPIGPAKGINELLYNWKNGHAPVSGLEKNNCLWWLLRAEREGFLNDDRQGIFNTSLSTLNRKFGTVYNFDSAVISKTFDKKRETEIIRNEVGFDISGTEYFEVLDIVNILKDCDD
jgi:hypothetical protein